MTEPNVMKCDVCGEPSTEGLVGVGAYCSKPCKKELIRKAREEEQELLDEEMSVTPDEFDIPAFERFILKVALHMIRDLPKKVRAEWQKRTPMLLSASNLSMEIKERVVREIPLFYVSSMEAEGREKLFFGGSFMFKTKVPKKVIWDALVKAKVLKAKRGE